MCCWIWEHYFVYQKSLLSLMGREWNHLVMCLYNLRLMRSEKKRQGKSEYKNEFRFYLSVMFKIITLDLTCIGRMQLSCKSIKFSDICSKSSLKSNLKGKEHKNSNRFCLKVFGKLHIFMQTPWKWDSYFLRYCEFVFSKWLPMEAAICNGIFVLKIESWFWSFNEEMNGITDAHIVWRA